MQSTQRDVAQLRRCVGLAVADIGCLIIDAQDVVLAEDCGRTGIVSFGHMRVRLQSVDKSLADALNADYFNDGSVIEQKLAIVGLRAKVSDIARKIGALSSAVNEHRVHLLPEHEQLGSLIAPLLLAVGCCIDLFAVTPAKNSLASIKQMAEA